MINPYENIERVTEKNGLVVYYAPSEHSRTIRVQAVVRAGWNSEERPEEGVSHLLEHYLFKDAKLGQSLTYLEVIKEKGGEANGYTTTDRTGYHATMPPQSLPWLLETFATMLFNRKFEDEELTRIKNPVFLEIGQISPWDPVLNAGLGSVFFPEFLEIGDRWKSEFGVNDRTKHSYTEKVNTRSFSITDLEKYYREYYRPSNMTLFISGNFKSEVIKPLVAKLFGTVVDHPGRTMPEQKLRSREKPYTRTATTSNTPFITIGTKLANTTFNEELGVKIYMNYLAHRLMKEIRNEQGDTYSAYSYVDTSRRHGFATVSLQSGLENYQRHVRLIRDRIQYEAQAGGLTREQFDQAIDLYRSKLLLKDSDSRNLERLAEELDKNYSDFGNLLSPYTELKRLSFETFLTNLKKSFAENRTYVDLTRPPVFFRFDEVIFMFAFLGLLFWKGRKLLAGQFAHDRLRWMRKMRMPPGYLLETSCFVLGCIFARYSMVTAELLFKRSEFLQSNVFTAVYLYGAVQFTFIFATIVLWLALITKKAIVSGDTLYLKTATYISRRVPLQEIESVELVRPFRFFLSLRLIKRVGLRFLDNTYFPGHGLVIHRRDGRSYYLNIQEPKKAYAELNRILDERKVDESTFAKAA